MKQQPSNELRQQTIPALWQLVSEIKQEITKAELEVKAGKRTNTHTRLIKDYLARVLTIIGEMKFAASKETKEDQS